MTDQAILDSYLLLLKSTVEVYVHGTLESTNKPVRELLQNCLNSTIEMQECTYNLMTEKGWYTVENISTKEINKVLNKVESGN